MVYKLSPRLCESLAMGRKFTSVYKGNDEEGAEYLYFRMTNSKDISSMINHRCKFFLLFTSLASPLGPCDRAAMNSW